MVRVEGTGEIEPAWLGHAQGQRQPVATGSRAVVGLALLDQRLTAAAADSSGTGFPYRVEVESEACPGLLRHALVGEPPVVDDRPHGQADFGLGGDAGADQPEQDIEIEEDFDAAFDGWIDGGVHARTHQLPIESKLRPHPEIGTQGGRGERRDAPYITKKRNHAGVEQRDGVWRGVIGVGEAEENP